MCAGATRVAGAPRALALLGDRQARALVPRVAALQLAVSLSEGFGLLLLVPLLGLVAGPAGGGGKVSAAMARAGLEPALGPLLVAFVALVTLRAALNMGRNRVVVALELALVNGLRRRAWRALLHADWRMLAGLRRSDQASLLVTNLDRVGAGVAQGLAGISALVTLAALGLAALAIAPLLAAGAAGAGVLVLLAYRGLRQQAARQGEALGRAWDRIHGALGEGLAALRSIKGLGLEDRAEAETLDRFAELGAARQAYVRSAGIGQLALQGGGAAALALLVWLAATVWRLPLAAILPMVALFARALPLLGTVQEAWQAWANARPALVAAQALVAAAEAAREPEALPGPAPRLREAIVLEGVGVRYAGQPEPALEGVSLTIPAGSIVALSGPSGAGKSTLADVLAGLVSPDSGVVTIDGEPLGAGNRRGWRMAVAYVEQDPLLLAATLRENLRWAAPEADDARLWAALEDAAAAGFVRALPEGLDTRVGDGGRRLSGGERQRLMLARALLRSPELLVLDEAASALDAANEALVAETLQRLRGRLTIVVIGHRGALAGTADHTVMLDSGRVVAVRSAA